MGEGTARRLEHVIRQREQNIVPAANIVDSRYQDLLDDPIACIARIYAHFDMTQSETAVKYMQEYLCNKPQGKFGQHTYEVDKARNHDRQLFNRYQSLYNVPDEL